ncbi:MAG: metallophosphoesterase [Caldilineaceae bacterium]
MSNDSRWYRIFSWLRHNQLRRKPHLTLPIALLLLLTLFPLARTNLSISVLASDQALVQAAGPYKHEGASEGSTAIVLDDSFMLVGDDNDNIIRLYNRRQDGGPLATFDLSNDLNVTKKIDLEGSTSRTITTDSGSTRRIYWIGSHSNDSDGNNKPTRYRFFATDLVGSGATTTLNFKGHYDGLRTDNNGTAAGDLIAWGDAHGYDFANKAAQGVNPEIADGFNIEGLAMNPDDTAIYVGFRAPLVGATKDQALIAPINNFDALIDGSASNANIGEPIELNLEGHGIRSIERNAAGEYLIIAGPPSQTGFFLFQWDGTADSQPQKLNLADDLTFLKTTGSFEGIVEVPSPVCNGTVQLLVDDGDSAFVPAYFRSYDIPLPSCGQPSGPTIAIDEPTTGDSFSQGVEINFVGFANDAAGNDIGSSITWNSSIDQQIGIGGSFTKSDLSPGEHVITASVTDGDGNSNSAQIGLTIIALDNLPAVTITQPTDHQTFTQGEAITFSGSATDPQDGDVTASLLWSSNVQGPIGEQGSFTKSDFHAGEHRITAMATDKDGHSGSSQITITILEPNNGTSTVYLPLIQKGNALAISKIAGIVPSDAVWKYLDNGSDPGSSWQQLNFDDSTWRSGQGELGYGDKDEATVINCGPSAPACDSNNFITSYFRHIFTIDDPSRYKVVDLQLLRDDSAVIYLNGQEVVRDNLPAGPMLPTIVATGAITGSNEKTFMHYTLSPSALVAGANILAVEVHQSSATSSDTSFDLVLNATPNDTTRFAVIGDYGTGTQPETDVANLVKRWTPDFIVTLGDNNYPSGEQATLETHITRDYSDFITNDVNTTRFWPSLGNHDWIATNAQPYLGYFTLPNNERYYDMVRGNVHLFAVDSDPHEPDGNTSNSTQAQWLQTVLQGSASHWKFVYFHHAPYSSSTHGPTVAMQWPFKDWGASVVLSGHEHSYERLELDGLTYFVNGLGGANRYVCKSPSVPGSQKCYIDDFGAMLVEADSCQMTFLFITRSGAIQDRHELSICGN